MVYWHIETDFVALAIFIVLFIKAVVLNKQKDFTDRTFCLALVIGTASTVVDIFSSTIMNNLTGWWIYEISMIIYGLFAPALTIVWVLYTVALLYRDNVSKAKRVIALFLIIYAAYAVVIVTNPLHSLYFSLSPEMVYARGPLFLPLVVGSQMFYALIGILLILGNWKKMHSKTIAALLLFLYFFTTVSYFIQLAFPGWLIICSAFAIALFVCDATFESQRRDALYQTIKKSLNQLQEEQKKELIYQEKLKEAAAEANRANQAKSTFLSRMSHDIRTPMNGIRGMLEIIRKERHNENRVNDCLSKIETASAHLLSLINDVLDMSKLESGDIILSYVPFDLREVAEDCYAIMSPLALEYGIALTCDTGEALTHSFLLGSPLHLRQIILNIVGNALKYTRAGGSVRFTICEQAVTSDQVTYRFTVSDTGIGIAPEFFPSLFEPFSQEHDSSHTNYEGTGLGLAIVKRIIDLMKGEITVESKVNQGSTFTFTIPFAIDPNPPAQTDASLEAAGQADFSGVHVLLVEDNALNQEIAQFVLEDAGITVDTAENGREAVDKFYSSKPDTYHAILMDIMMPVMNGLDATRAIRALDHPNARNIPIIAMTANAFSEDAAKCLEAGMNAHLTKPLDSAALLKALTFHLDNRQTADKQA